MADQRGMTMRAWVVCLSVVLLAVTGCGGEGSKQQDLAGSDAPRTPVPTQAIEIKGQAFDLELALDDDARGLGLSDRKEIAEDGGMMFVFTSPRRSRFVMRRCYVPIDLIYVDEDGYIDSLHRMEVIEPIGGPLWKNPLDGYASVGRVVVAIELKGGWIDRMGLKRGEKLDLPIQALQSRAE